jgi:superoxide reductase
MALQIEKTEDEGKEKHKPVIKGNQIRIGSIEHPMEEEHYIEWLETEHVEGDSKSRIFLQPGQKPGADISTPPKSARAYCNVHGLWKSE